MCSNGVCMKINIGAGDKRLIVRDKTVEVYDKIKKVKFAL
jgi:hypothetical protein